MRIVFKNTYTLLAYEDVWKQRNIKREKFNVYLLESGWAWEREREGKRVCTWGCEKKMTIGKCVCIRSLYFEEEGGNVDRQAAISGVNCHAVPWGYNPHLSVLCLTHREVLWYTNICRVSKKFKNKIYDHFIQEIGFIRGVQIVGSDFVSILTKRLSKDTKK